MKNPYVQATLKTLAFVLYIVLMVTGFIYLRDNVSAETVENVFYVVGAGFGIAVIFMLNLARARYNQKD